MIINSIMALVLIYFAFRVDWIFLIGAVALMIINQKILIKKKK